MKLKGKKVLVTGASQGIGKAIALALAANGAQVAIHYHDNQVMADEVAAQIKLLGGTASIFKADFNNPGEAVRLGNEVWEALGGIDFLINNAGVCYKVHFLDATSSDVDYFTNINFKSTLLLTQTIARKMVQSNIQGSIYTITSINGLQPGVGLNIYGATKGALETLMKGVALELAPHNIKVNTIAAGAIQTAMNIGVASDAEKLQSINDNIPMGRLGQPEEIANIICSLLAADSYMTGTTIVVDGGWLLKNGYANPKLYNINKSNI